MGTTYTIKLVARLDAEQRRALHGEIEKELDEINRSMSTYDPRSELSRWNASRSSDWFSVSAQLARVVAEAIAIGRACDGGFDVTVDPLVRLWGFGPERNTLWETADIPSSKEIEDARQLVDFSRLEIRRDPPGVRKAVGRMRVDLSGIAKGHAVDRLAALLQSRGYRNFMVEIGGELSAAGHNAAGGAWRIAIESPQVDVQRIESVVKMDGRAMATSGDYRNYREKNGVRYSHIIDPRTGRPIRHRLASVSVLADRCSRADAWATGLMVLGFEAGCELAESQGIAANFILRDGGGFVQKHTSHWPVAQTVAAAAADTPVDPPNAQAVTAALVALIASLVAMASAMLALSIGPVFRKRKPQCSCKTAGQITGDAGCCADTAPENPRGSPLLPVITSPKKESFKTNE